MKSSPLRSAVIEFYKQVKRPVSIASMLKMPIQTIRDAIKRYNELGNLEDRSGRGRKRTARTPGNRITIRHRINRDSRRSIQKVSKSLKIDPKFVRTIHYKDLG